MGDSSSDQRSTKGLSGRVYFGAALIRNAARTPTHIQVALAAFEYRTSLQLK